VRSTTGETVKRGRQEITFCLVEKRRTCSPCYVVWYLAMDLSRAASGVVTVIAVAYSFSGITESFPLAPSNCKTNMCLSRPFFSGNQDYWDHPLLLAGNTTCRYLWIRRENLAFWRIRSSLSGRVNQPCGSTNMPFPLRIRNTAPWPWTLRKLDLISILSFRKVVVQFSQLLASTVEGSNAVIQGH
jgi:hypothetical protein